MAHLSINYASKMTPYAQEPGMCAAACAGMCVNKSTAQLRADNVDLSNFSFSAVATKYSYKSVDNPGPQSYSTSFTASTLLSMLKLGYPVITKTRHTGQASATEDHWVTVTSFSGDDTSPSYSNFTCYDPASGFGWKTLTNSDRFKGFYRYVYYYK